MQRKQKRGSALAMVLMFMTLMVVLGAALIAAAQYGVTQSAAIVRADKHYYAAESGAQLAAQIFLSKLDAIPDNGGYLLSETFPEGADMDDELKNMKNRLLGIIGGHCADTAAQIESREFNGERVSIDPDFGITQDHIGGDYEAAININDLKTYTAIVYLENPKFTISAVSGGRTVTIVTDADISALVTATPTELPLEGAGGLSGVYYQGESGGIYSDEPNIEKYEACIEALRDLLIDAAAKYDAHADGAGIIPGGVLPERHAFNPADTNARYINTWSVATLGRAGETTVYPNLEYLRTDSGLEILGNVELPNLKGVVAGGNSRISGTVNLPRLENFFSSGNITIEAGARINQDVKTTGKCNFYGASVLTINCDATVNWCRFYVRNVVINYGSFGKLTSNSVFLPRLHLDLRGTASSDTEGVIPQFYVAGSGADYVHLSGSIGTFSGILMALGDDWVVGNSNGFTGNTDLFGFFIGNFNTHSGPITNATVHGFTPSSNLDLLMDNGIVNYLGGGGGYEIETSIEFYYDFKGLNLRETTGEN